MLKLGKKSSVDLLSGDEGWVIFKFSVPIILSYLLQQIYTISDAAICGQTLGVDDIAGVNDVFPILFIFLQFAVGCTAGFSVITSIAAGRADQARVRRSFAAQLVLGGVLSLALTGAAVLTLKPLLRFIGLSEANPGVWRAAYQYSLVIFLGIFAQLYYNLICSVLRSLGDSTTPLIFLLFSTVLNIGLDLLFILVFRLGVIGAAAATVLAQAMIREGLKNLAAGANPMVMRRGIQKATEAAVDAIRTNSQPVSGSGDIARVGAISSGDEHIGKLIAEAMEKVSQNGVITVEESKTAETYSEVVEGMQFDRGYVTPYMVTDNDKMEAVIDDALILITDKKISNIQEILPVLEAVLNAGKKLVIIADDIEGEALATIILNKLRGTFTCVCVKAPGFGDRRKEMLQDIAILTGGQVISTDLGMELKDTTLAQLGHARQVKVTKETTTIVEGAGAKDDIQSRIAQIRAQIETTTSEYDKEKLQERLAKLSGGVAVIKVGAATETEMKEKKLRIEDALNATRAAVEEGVVAGGGTAYVVASKAAQATAAKLSGDEKTGANIIAAALRAPICQIAANAGVEGAVILDKVSKSKSVNYGYDAAHDTFGDMIDNGIVDPTKVCRSALENAASVSSMVLTTESLVADLPEKAAPAAPAAPDMGGMY